MTALIHQNIEFHNAGALETLCGMPGLCPVRVPASVRHRLCSGTRVVSESASGVELRFVAPGGKVRLAFAAQEQEVQLHVYRGAFDVSNPRIPAGEQRVITLDPPERFGLTQASALQSGAFSPEVWRVVISGGVLGFLGLDDFGTPVRPPAAAETPAVRWLAYGSSITQSWAKGYPHQAARRLGIDVLNKGMSGNCHIEPEMADYLAELDWEIATLELGVNMRVRYTPEAFASRARDLIDRLRAAKPRAPLVLITTFRNLDHFPAATPPPAAERQTAFDRILRQLHQERNDPHLHLLEGLDLLQDFSAFSADLLHPSDYGQQQIGENLANALRPLLP